jgi:hypothetical protein
MKFYIPFLFLAASVPCFAEVKFSETTQNTVKGIVSNALSLKEKLTSSDNGTVRCIEKLSADIASANGDLNQLLGQGDYKIVQNSVEELLTAALSDEALTKLKGTAVATGAEEDWRNLKIATFHFVGRLLEEKIPNRFHKQQPGERDFAAWLNRNDRLDPEKDFDIFIAGFMGQFHIAETVTAH